MTWSEASNIARQAENDIDSLEKEVNRLIKEFTTKYTEPYFVITEGKEYKIRGTVFTTLITEQSQNS